MNLLTSLFVWLIRPAADPLQPVDQDPDAVREEACRIVSRNKSVCAPPNTTPPRSASGGSSFNLNWLGALLWIVFIAVIILLLILLVRFFAARSGSGGARRKRAATDDLDEVELDAVVIDRSREPTNWRMEAEEHRRAGRYREAMRCRYRALVGDLARRGLIDEIPGRTTGEERIQLGQVQPNAGSPFTSAADLFDDAWYGHVAVYADDDERFQSFERDVLSKTGPSHADRRK